MKNKMNKIGMVLCALLGTASLHGQTSLSITGFSPKTGPPGTIVTVTGTGFRSTTYIRLGSAGLVTAHEVNSAGTELKFRVPESWRSRSAGPLTVNFSYHDHTRTPKVTSADNFTPTPLSITGFAPKTGLPGTEITVTGTGFDIRTYNPISGYSNYIHLGSAGVVIAYAVNSAGTELKFRVPESWRSRSA
ncbi:MAG: IPT/TIG domain-containing protein, partial [Cytophagales bacterium]|nr:IPT/TIG domain-containing protein [Cytophagales bacterium]